MRPDGTVGLREAIEGLRQELAWSAYWGNGQRLRFKPGPVELTVQATLTTKGEGHAGVRWWVLDAGASGSLENAAVQTVKLTLEPVLFDQAGNPLAEQLIDDIDEPGSPDAAADDRMDDTE